MQRYTLKYGCNPDRKNASVSLAGGGELPFEVLNGNPGYINFLDALNSWQLVSELRTLFGVPAAASFKHVSPAGAALGLPMSEALKRACYVDDIAGLDSSPLALAYARARGADRLSSYGDWIALSDVCDAVTASIIKREVSDGVIAPDYTEQALELLRSKKGGRYNIVKMDPDYTPAPTERREVFGITFEQGRAEAVLDFGCLENIVTREKYLPESAKRDLLVSLITLRYTQSNSVCFAYDGQAIGVGAGQQSRVHCTRLAGNKADMWFLRQTPDVLELPFLPELGRAQRDNVIDAYINHNEEDVCAEPNWRKYFSSRPQPLTDDRRRALLGAVHGAALGSDAFFPFEDSIERGRLSGVSYVAQPGGSVRDSDVIAACDRYGMVMAFTGIRLFHH